MLKKVIIFISFLFPVFAFSAPTVLAPSNAIYLGDSVLSDLQFPFVVGIYEKTDDHPESFSEQASCTGTIIGKNWVLTAAHCVRNGQEIMRPDTVLIGTGHLAKQRLKATTLINVKNIFLFKKNNNYLTYDVALLQLTEATDIHPVILPTSAHDFPNLKTSHMPAIELGYGWVNVGSQSYFDFQFDEYLHMGDQIIQDDHIIRALIKKYKTLDPITPEEAGEQPYYNPQTMLGVTSPSGKRATHDDSGGPLLLSIESGQDKNYVQVGVASSMGGIGFSERTINEGYFMKEPMIFANLTDQDTLNFIYTTMLNNEEKTGGSRDASG